MGCQICNICVVGESYDLPNGICEGCQTVFGAIGTYLEWHNDKHVFRLHRSTCPNCGYDGKYGLFDCADYVTGIDVTEEFNVMFHRKDSHWLGGKRA